MLHRSKINRFARELLEIRIDFRLWFGPSIDLSNAIRRQLGIAARTDGVVSGSYGTDFPRESICFITKIPVSISSQDVLLQPSSIISYNSYKKPPETHVLLPKNAT